MDAKRLRYKDLVAKHGKKREQLRMDIHEGVSFVGSERCVFLSRIFSISSLPTITPLLRRLGNLTLVVCVPWFSGRSLLGDVGFF